jgi:hypothetical protein
MSLSGNLKSIVRSSPQLYRDCLRLIKHIAGRSKKGFSLQAIVRSEFIKHSKETDDIKIEQLKSNAVRGLANYLMIESASKDTRLQKFSSTYVQKEADSLKQTEKEKSG